MITGSILVADYLDAQRLHRARGARWFIIFCTVPVILGVAAFLMFQIRFGITLALIGLFCFALEFGIGRFYLPWRVQRLYRQQKDFASPFTYTWDATHLEGKSAVGQAKRAWRDYAKAKENDKLFLIYHADNLFEAIPKRWFNDAAQIAEFRQFAKPTVR